MDLALKAYGEKGVLAYDLGEPEREGLCQALLKSKPENCLEYIEGYNTVLFIFKNSASIKELSKWLVSIDPAPEAQSKPSVRVIPVSYDGPDLESVATQAGLSIDQVIEIHSSSIYTVRMMGFTPGFPYLDGLDTRLHLPRKASPKTRIEPGSVAIGGPHAGIYSVASPGGWHLLGRTDFLLFDAKAAQAAEPTAKEVFAFSPGDCLRFQPVT